ncbi:MAG: hypothetical protein ABIP02_08490 [Arenimonas sp.]
MNNHLHQTISNAELHLQLRGLPKERAPESDLWMGIQASIQHTSAKKGRWYASPFAMVASLAFVLVLALPLFSRNQIVDNNTLKAQVVASEVKAMNIEYQAALKEFSSVQLPPDFKTQVQLLDDSANKLRQALDQSPQSTYLLPMLRRTYLQRLQLTQRAIASNFT